MADLRVKIAWLLLLLIVLDLSTGGVCTAGTLPKLDVPADLTLSSAGTAQAQPVPNVDDDGCFCCCTHLLSSQDSVSAPPEPVVPFSSVVRVVNASAVPQSPFHPPKQ